MAPRFEQDRRFPKNNGHLAAHEGRLPRLEITTDCRVHKGIQCRQCHRIAKRDCRHRLSIQHAIRMKNPVTKSRPDALTQNGICPVEGLGRSIGIIDGVTQSAQHAGNGRLPRPYTPRQTDDERRSMVLTGMRCR